MKNDEYCHMLSTHTYVILHQIVSLTKYKYFVIGRITDRRSVQWWYRILNNTSIVTKSNTTSSHIQSSVFLYIYTLDNPPKSVRGTISNTQRHNGLKRSRLKYAENWTMYINWECWCLKCLKLLTKVEMPLI